MRFKFIYVIIILSALQACNGAGAKILFRNAPNVTDYKIFKNITLKAAEQPFVFQKKSNIAIPNPQIWIRTVKKQYEEDEIEEFLEASKTTAFIIIKNDTIIYESYHNGFDRNQYMQVFSITKSFTATLTQIAIQEGYIKSVEQPIADFLPLFNDDEHKQIKIKHLLDMTSGFNFQDETTLIRLGRTYYNNKVSEFIPKVGMKHTPGTFFAYSSFNSLLLGMCIEAATGQTYSEYLEEKLWQPLGMEFDGLMNITKKDSIAQSFGGLSSNAIDLAKFGRLYLHNGNWNGEQLLSPEWVAETNDRDTSDGAWYGYNNNFWMNTYRSPGDYVKPKDHVPPPSDSVFQMTDYTANGYQGQNIYISPEHDMIIVRLGSKRGDVVWFQSFPKLCELLTADE